MILKSNIYEIKIRDGQNKYDLFPRGKWYAVKYIDKHIHETILIFNGKDPGSSIPYNTIDGCKKRYKIIGQPIKFEKFKKFFDEYKTIFNKEFKYESLIF